MLTLDAARDLLQRATFRIRIERTGRSWEWGTGFFISPSGLALTAFHNLPVAVTAHGRGTISALYKDVELQLECVMAVSSQQHDIAVVRPVFSPAGLRVEHLPVAYLGRAYDRPARIRFWAGRPVCALGFPFRDKGQREWFVHGDIDSAMTIVDQFEHDDDGHGRDVTVKIERLLFFGREAYHLEGISGAPVLDRQTGWVIAVEGSYDPDKREVCASEIAPLVARLRADWPEIASHIHALPTAIHEPFAAVIEEKTADFIGRDFLVSEIDAFLASNDRGYFLIQGEPGIGKTSVAAQLVKTRGYVHHFNDVLQGMVHADQFVRSVGAQLLARYQVGPHLDLGADFHDPRLLSALLEDIGRRMPTDERVVIVVDALDEVERSAAPRTNLLLLPPRLPRRIYFIVTSRPLADLPFHVETPRRRFQLDADSAENLADVRSYLERAVASRSALRRQLEDSGTTVDRFLEVMISKSEGNFMYLQHVLPEIERGEYVGGNFEVLPQGLRAYYENHWQKMKGQDHARWSRLLQPVICVLAAVRELVSIGQVADFSGLSRTDVAWVIAEWREFLRERLVEGERRFRIYHASFQDFLSAKDEVGELDLKAVHRGISDVLLKAFDASRPTH